MQTRPSSESLEQHFISGADSAKYTSYNDDFEINFKKMIHSSPDGQQLIRRRPKKPMKKKEKER